jgi:histidine triad (HIT) family protein
LGFRSVIGLHDLLALMKQVLKRWAHHCQIGAFPMPAAYDESNIFARILRGEIPSHKVFEDRDTLVIMDVMPQSKGHALVIPKRKSRNLLDADPAALGPALKAAQKTAAAAVKAFAADGVMLVQYNEAPAGQTVFHLHFHVIPRYEGLALKPHGGPMEDNAVLAANAAAIRSALG